MFYLIEFNFSFKIFARACLLKSGRITYYIGLYAYVFPGAIFVTLLALFAICIAVGGREGRILEGCSFILE